MRKAFFGCFGCLGADAVMVDGASPLERQTEPPFIDSSVQAVVQIKELEVKAVAVQKLQEENMANAASCPELQDLLTSRPTGHPVVNSISGPHPKAPQITSNPVYKSSASTIQVKDLLDSDAFNVEAVETISRNRTESQVPSSILRASSSVNSPRRMDTDPMIARMKMLLDKAYGSSPGPAHFTPQQSGTHSQRPADIEFITRIAHQCGQGVKYQANLARWRASEEQRIKNNRTLDILATRDRSTGQVLQSNTRPAAPSITEEMIVNYLHARHILSNGGGRYLPHYPQSQRLAYDKTPTVYSNVNPSSTPKQSTSHQTARKLT